jgi:hypothetical protein
MRVIQYSPPPEIVSFFREYPFAYILEHHDGHVITTMNRVRMFLGRVFGLPHVSRGLIE